jgi:hypothetical protein
LPELVGNGRQLLAELEAVEEQLRKTAEQLMVGKASAADSMKDMDKNLGDDIQIMQKSCKKRRRKYSSNLG